MENNLLEQLKAKAGLSEEQALKAVQTLSLIHIYKSAS